MKNHLKTAALLALLALPFGCATLLPEPMAQDAVRSNALWPGIQLSDLQRGRSFIYTIALPAMNSTFPPNANQPNGKELW